MNEVEVYKVAFRLAQEGNSVLLFAFESTKRVVYELLISEYTNTPLAIMREDSTIAKEKQDEFLSMIDRSRNFEVKSEVKMSNVEIEEHIAKFKIDNPLTHVVFDKDIGTDFFFKLQTKFSVKVISSTLYIDEII